MSAPEYKSETYYSVVIGSGTFMGWKCIFAGDGALAFRNQSGDAIRYSDGGVDWMRKCWDRFTADAIKLTPQSTAQTAQEE